MYPRHYLNLKAEMYLLVESMLAVIIRFTVVLFTAGLLKLNGTHPFK